MKEAVSDDAVPVAPERSAAMELLDLAPLIAEAILRIHEKAHAAKAPIDRV